MNLRAVIVGLILSVAAMTALPCAAVELDVDGDFSETDADGRLLSWEPQPSADFEPHAAVEVLREGDANVLHLSGVQGRYGDMLRSVRHYACVPEDIVTIRLWARGRGHASFTAQLFRNKSWLGRMAATKRELQDVWTQYECSYVLSGNANVTAFDVAIGLEPGAEIYVRDVRLSRNLEVTETLAIDDFESVRERSGDPRLLQGYTAPGLLALTGLGRYTTSGGRVALVPDETVSLPAADERHFFQSSFRLYDFGSGNRTASRLRTLFGAGESSFAFDVAQTPASEDLVCTFGDANALVCPLGSLPADFVLSVSADGLYDLTVTSLSDASVRSVTGTNDFLRGRSGPLTRSVTLLADGAAAAEVTVDNLASAYACAECRSKNELPYLADPQPTFDPEAAGWPLVFNEEFDGTEVDTNKWEHSSEISKRQCHVSDGTLKIATEYPEGQTNLVSGGLWARQGYCYGYFEAKVKFTTYNGWWAAFWLCTHSCGNPFVDGFEIDVFEDYYMRNAARNTLDHNLHITGAGVLKSWNYNSTIPGTHEDWYTIGCKWTPFEITYYVNGEAIPSTAGHSPYRTVTFDAFRHGTGIVPLKPIVSGQIMKTAYGWHEPTPDEIFPENYEVDYVRVYGYPGSAEGAAPTVTMSDAKKGRYMIAQGSTLNMKVQARPAAKTGSPIKAVHLFDDGFYVTTVTNEPYEFQIPMSKAYYNKTRWMNPGRQSTMPTFDGSLHVFSAFAEDESGEVGHSETVMHMVAPTVRSTPYGGTPQSIPGTIVIGRYDEGGQGVAYYDTTENHAHSTTWRMSEWVDGGENSIGSVASAEWLNYTVDVARPGRYLLKFNYGTPQSGDHSVRFMLDGELIALLPLHRHASEGFGTDTVAEAVVKLPAGNHMLTLQIFGTYNIGNFSFTELDFEPQAYVWSGLAQDGDWKNPLNWDRTYGWDFPYARDTAVFTNDVTVVSDFSLDEGQLTLDVATNATLTVDCTVSGVGGLTRVNGGALHLKQKNTFTGPFVSTGTSDCSPAASGGQRGFSGEVYVYHGEAMGATSAAFDADCQFGHGSRLNVVGPMEIPIPVRLSGDGIQQGNVRYIDTAGGEVVFKEPVSSDCRYCDSGPAGTTVRFEKGYRCTNYVLLSSGFSYVFGSPSSGTCFYLGGNVRATLDASAFEFNSLQFAGANAWIDLAGHDLAITNKSCPIGLAASVADGGFTSSDGDPAQVRFSGPVASYPNFRGQFAGSAGLEWNPDDASHEFVFTNGIQRSSGVFGVSRGALRLRGGASFRRVGGIAVGADGTFAVEADAGEVLASNVTVAAGGTLSIAAGRTVNALSATIGGERLAPGTYTAADWPETIVGGGSLVVDDRYRNEWRGTVGGDWMYPANWSFGWLPGADEKVVLKTGAKAVVPEDTGAFGQLLVEEGATLVQSNWTSRVRADEIVVNGTVTTFGSFTNDAPQARVWLTCRDLTVGATGAIDVDGKGWSGGRYAGGQRPGCGPGASATSCGAAHGGCGSMTVVGRSIGKVYDDPHAPSLPGSGAYSSSGTAGGGAVRVEATGTVRVDGRIAASGIDAVGITRNSTSGQFCGSGGSVWISATVLEGSGEIRADGGDGDLGSAPDWVWTYRGCSSGGAARCGGGGMIRLEYAAESEAAADVSGLVVSAGAGIHRGLLNGTGRLTAATHDKFRTEADLGTLTFTDETLVRKLLGKGLTGRLVDVSDYAHEGDLVWTDGHVRFAGEGATVSVAGDFILSNDSSRAEIGGLFTRTNGGVIADCWGGTKLNSLTVGGSLRILNGAALDIRAAETNGTERFERFEGFGGVVSVKGDLVVGAGSWLYPWCDVKNLAAPCFDVGGAFTVEAGGTVMADRRGGMGGRGGSGWQSYFDDLKSSSEGGRGLGASSNTGSSHGGVGGVGYASKSDATTGRAGSLVDDEWTADCPGAGGGGGGYGEGGEGGGLVHVTARGPITVDGAITANGWFGSYNNLGSATSNSGYAWYFGSGAGGGIRLYGASFAGSGRLSACGGDAVGGYADDNAVYGYASGCGGGGRILIATGADVEAAKVKSQVFRSTEMTDVDIAPGVAFTGVVELSGGTNIWPKADKVGDPVQFERSHGSAGTVRFTRMIEIIELYRALNTTGLVWTTEGDAEWRPEWSADAPDGRHRARSGVVGNGSNSVLSVILSGKGVLTFDWKADCLPRYDAVRLEVDGALVRSLSGQTDWTTVSVPLPVGEHVVRWIFSRGRQGGAGANAVYLDRVVWTPAPVPTLAEALDSSLTWTTGGDADWECAYTDASYAGDSCAVSGLIGDYEETWLATSVTGAGRLEFAWATSCEESYDWLEFAVDGEIVNMITGETGWKTVRIDLDEGEHAFRWTYWKDGLDEPELVGADCAFLDYVRWTPATDVTDPDLNGVSLAEFCAWLKEHRQLAPEAPVESAAPLATRLASAKPMTLLQEFVAGTDPEREDSTFTALIEVEDGQPKVSWTPALNGEGVREGVRTYRVFGSNDLQSWDEVPAGGESGYKFFKVSVEMAHEAAK